MLKYVSLLILSTLAITLGACAGVAQEAGEDLSGTYPTVGFERTVETDIGHPPAQVCPYYEPAGRALVYSWWDPLVLRQPIGDTLVGLTTVSHAHGNHSAHPIFLFVTEHDPEQWHMQYQVLWGDYELQRIDITCVENGAGGTHVTWLERNAGLHENGVPAVTNYVENGHLDHMVEAYAQRIADAIAADGG